MTYGVSLTRAEMENVLAELGRQVDKAALRRQVDEIARLGRANGNMRWESDAEDRTFDNNHRCWGLFAPVSDGGRRHDAG